MNKKTKEYIYKQITIYSALSGMVKEIASDIQLTVEESFTLLKSLELVNGFEEQLLEIIEEIDGEQFLKDMLLKQAEKVNKILEDIKQ